MRFNFSTGDNFTEGVSIVAPLYEVFDNVQNDSDKSFTVPQGEMWMLMYASVNLTSTATVGNRQARLSITNAHGNEMLAISAGAVQAASLTRRYNFFPCIPRETAAVDGMVQVSIPPQLYLPAGYTIRLFERFAIDPAADDMTVSFQVQMLKGC